MSHHPRYRTLSDDELAQAWTEAASELLTTQEDADVGRLHITYARLELERIRRAKHAARRQRRRTPAED